jgi:hypothetical protein
LYRLHSMKLLMNNSAKNVIITTLLGKNGTSRR